MLVVISDLHLSDGSYGRTLSPGAFEMFATRLADMAHRASFRADGTYRPVDSIELILLGDVLDITRSSRWLASDVRPWSDPAGESFGDEVGRITTDILENNAMSIRVLRHLAGGDAIHLPVATAHGPNTETRTTGVPVRIHYMVGNHDWYLHLRGAKFNLVRQQVALAMGLVNPHQSPFPHDPQESDELMEVMRRHRLLCRHGDIYDPMNFSDDRDLSSVGDAIVVDLMIRFENQIRQRLGDDLPDSVIQGLGHLDKIRPTLLIPVWIEGMLQRSSPTPAVRREIKQTWDHLVDEFLESSLIQDRDTWCPFDLIDGLQTALKFSKRMSIGWASRVTTWLAKLRNAKGESFANQARLEQDYRNRRARHIVYGHTHHFESVPLDASFADALVLNQMYFNAGTWQRVFRPTFDAPGECEFIPTEAMSYLSFFHGDERGGRPFESWTGTLGIHPFECVENLRDNRSS